LWEVVSTIGIGIVEGTDEVAVYVPLDIAGCPVDLVGMESGLRSRNRVVDSSVISSGVALAKVVALNFGGVAT